MVNPNDKDYQPEYLDSNKPNSIGADTNQENKDNVDSNTSQNSKDEKDPSTWPAGNESLEEIVEREKLERNSRIDQTNTPSTEGSPVENP